MNDFWLSSGHHLLDRDERGRLQVTDEFIKLYFARPELAPPRDACVAESTLHAALLSDPWRPISQVDIDAIRDVDARENWLHMMTLRNYFVSHSTIESAYMALVHNDIGVPPIFMDQMVHLILRNALDGCDDAFVLRAAEMFFRPQRLTVHKDALLVADQEYVEKSVSNVSPLSVMFGFPEQLNVDVLSDANASSYWDRSDRFDTALDLSAGRRGLAALAKVTECWTKHLLGIDVTIEPVIALQDAKLAWYVGLDANGTKVGDALWNGADLDEATRSSVVGLFRLVFRHWDMVIEEMVGEATYLILAMAPDNNLRIKPQNLLVGLPLRRTEPVT